MGAGEYVIYARGDRNGKGFEGPIGWILSKLGHMTRIDWRIKGSVGLE